MALGLLPQLLDTCTRRGLRLENGLDPGAVLAHVEHGAQVARQAVGALHVGLVDHEDVADFQDPGLEHLHHVARGRR